MAEDQTSREILEQLVERLDHLERVLQSNTMRLHAVERRVGLEPLPTDMRRRPVFDAHADERDEAQPPATEAHAAETDATSRGTEASTTQTPPFAPRATQAPPFAPRAREAEARRGPYAGASSARAAATRETKRRDIESLVGGSWFNWIGIIAVTFGVAFFLKLAFDNQWIGPRERITLGALAGMALLYVGERLRRRGLRSYAYVMSGGGVLILYLSVYAAYNFYQLIAQPVAFLLMALVTTTAVVLSVRQNALPVAILGLAGGFLTPALLSTGTDNEVALFTYVALLDAGVLAVAYFKRWRSLDFLSFAGTFVTTLGWAFTFWGREKLWTTLAFLTVFFVLYSLLAVFHNVLPRRPSRWFDVALSSANAALYFGLSYLMLTDARLDRATPASLALLISAYFACLFYAAWSRCRPDRLLTYGYVSAAVTFFTIAAAIQLDLQWVTIAWAVEGLMLLWAGLRSGESAARHAALAVYGVAALHWLAWDAPEFAFAGGGFTPLLNPRALSCAALVASLACGAWLYRREGQGLGESEREAGTTLCALAANALALVLLTLDLSDYFERQKVATGGAAADSAWRRIENARQFSLSAVWTIYGATLLAYGVRRGLRALRYAALALLIAATAKALSLDLQFYAAPWHVPVFNQTFMAFALLVAAYALAARLYARDTRGAEEERSVVPVLVVIANVLAVVALSAEAAGYFDAGRAALADTVRLRDLGLAKQLSLSVVWALYGAGLLVAGRVRRRRLLRVMSLALLSLTTLKVFFWDLSSLDRVYRIISFIVLGAILLAVSYLYQKSQQRAAEEDEADNAASGDEQMNAEARP